VLLDDEEYACCCNTIGEKIVPTITIDDAIMMIVIRVVIAWFIYSLTLAGRYIRDMQIVTLFYFLIKVIDNVIITSNN
jgi:hypothetical protein